MCEIWWAEVLECADFWGGLSSCSTETAWSSTLKITGKVIATCQCMNKEKKCKE